MDSLWSNIPSSDVFDMEEDLMDADKAAGKELTNLWMQDDGDEVSEGHIECERMKKKWYKISQMCICWIL